MRNDIYFLEKEDVVKEYKIRKIKFRDASFYEINNKWQSRDSKKLEPNNKEDSNNYSVVDLVKKVYKSDKLKDSVNAIETEWGTKKVIKSKPLTVKDKMYNGFLYNSSNLLLDENATQMHTDDVEVDYKEIEKTVNDAFNNEIKEETIISPEEVETTISGTFDNVKVSKNESGKAKIAKYSDNSFSEYNNEDYQEVFKITDLSIFSNDDAVVDNKFNINDDIFGVKKEETQVNAREIPIVVTERKITKDIIKPKLFEFEKFNDISNNDEENIQSEIKINDKFVKNIEEKSINMDNIGKVSDILESVKKLEEQKEAKIEKAEIAKKKAAEKEEEKKKALEELIFYKESLTADIKEIEDIERINIEKASNDDKIIGDIYSAIGNVEKFAK